MTTEQDLLSTAALTSFRLSGQFLSMAEELARPVGLTAARWQVLGAVLNQPLPVAGIARVMGLTRQSVQRIADRLVDDGLATYSPNPAHNRSKLVSPTEAGFKAVRAINPAHSKYAERLAETAGTQELTEAVRALTKLSQTLEDLHSQR